MSLNRVKVAYLETRHLWISDDNKIFIYQDLTTTKKGEKTKEIAVFKKRTLPDATERAHRASSERTIMAESRR